MPDKLVCVLFALVVTVPLHGAQGRSKEGQGIHDQSREYKALMEQLFIAPEANRPHLFTAVLRFLPSFQPEEEIILTLGLDSSSEITTFSLDRSIWSSLGAAIGKHKSVTPAVIASAAGMRKTRLPVKTEDTKQWLAMLFGSVNEYAGAFRDLSLARKAPEAFVPVDGVQYDLVLETMQGRIALEVKGSGTLDDNVEQNAVVTAMKSIRANVRELLRKR
jgi:hypothetical protein